MADLPVIQLPLPEEEQPKTLYARITNANEPPKFDDIMNSDLSRDEKVKQIQYRTKAYQDDVDRELHKNYARIGLGGLVSVVGALPIAITKNPVIGSAIGGGVYELGQGIMESDEFPELMQRSGFGAAIGGAAGGVVSKAPQAAKFVNDLSGGKIGNALKPIGDKITNNKLYDALMTDIRAFNPNKQIAYHGSPYDFEKFSNEAIGSGEGAQAHGYGHYVAKNKGTGEAYAKNLSEGNKVIEYDGKIYKSNAEFKPNEYNYKMLSDVKTDGIESAKKFYKDQEQWAREKLAKSNNKEWWEDTVKAAEGTNKLLDTVNPNLISDIKPDTGQLYKLSVPKDDVMLREDALMSAQPNMANLWNEIRLDRLNRDTASLPKFKMALGANDIDINKTFNTNYFNDALEIVKNNPEQYKDLFFKDMIGRDLYDYLTKSLGSKKAATEYLQQRGIKGISYNGGMDGEARVIFNPDDIVIGRKFYNQPSLYQQLTGKQNTGASSSGLYDYLSNPKANPQYEQELQKLYNPPNNIDPNTIRINIGDVSNDAYNLGLQNGYDLTDYQHFLDNSGFNHFMNGHYGINEVDNRLIPLEDYDIRNIPNVIYSPDTIEFLPKTVRKLPRIKYTKNTDNGKQIYVEQIQNKKKRLNTKTMWKEK